MALYNITCIPHGTRPERCAGCMVCGPEPCSHYNAAVGIQFCLPVAQLGQGKKVTSLGADLEDGVQKTVAAGISLMIAIAIVAAMRNHPRSCSQPLANPYVAGP